MPSSAHHFNESAGSRVKSFIVTTKSRESGYDFLSRVFVPWAGIPEDAGKLCYAFQFNGTC